MSDQTSDRTKESAPPTSGRQVKKPAVAPPRRRPSLFTIVSMAFGLIAALLIAWRIGKAWRIEYGGGPREARPIPTTGAWGPPGGMGPPPAASSSGR